MRLRMEIAMIRYVKQLVLLCAFLALAVSFTACKEEVKNHVCGSWTVVKEPTCLEKGLRVRTCTVCGEEETEDIGIVAHRYNDIRHCIWCNKQEVTESLKYELAEDGKSYIITGYNGSKSDIVLPCEYNGLPVSAIADFAFAKNTKLTTLYIHSSLSKIGKEAFSSCISLVSVSLPKSVTEIGENAFLGCEKLVEVINHSPLDVEEGSDGNGCIGKYARFIHTDVKSKINDKDGYLYFEDDGIKLVGYVGDKTDIVLPENINGERYSVYQYAFSSSSISSVEITSGALEVGRYAFNYCSSLENVKISVSDTTFGESVFESCILIKKVEFSDSVKSIGASMFRNCASLAELVLPESLENIPESAFRGCSSLKSVHIQSSVSAVGDYAFYGCPLLSNITFADGVKKIGMYAFSGCTSLEMLELSPSVREIGDFAFYSCSSLKRVAMPSELERIGNYAFKDCTSLSEITYPRTMLKWGGILKGTEWNTNTAGITVACSDGTL